MYKIIILGSGAAPGVPAIAMGWGNCNPENPKNFRTRTTTYLEYNGTKLLIDTSPDLRGQMLQNGITTLDAVLYTHSHADHLHGIDDLREINRINHGSLDVYASDDTVRVIKQRFPYLLATPSKANNVSMQPSLVANEVKYYEPFYINDLKIVAVRLLGHAVPSTGYIFNDGEVVYIADYRKLEDETFKFIKKEVELAIFPMTTMEGSEFHAGLNEILQDIKRFGCKQAIVNHMAAECDYDEVRKNTPKNVEPAYDNMVIKIE